MCELVWGELDTFVKKIQSQTKKNISWVRRKHSLYRRKARQRARPDIDGDDGPRSRPPYTYTTRPSARVMCVPNMVSKSMSVRGAIPYSVLAYFTWDTWIHTKGYGRWRIPAMASSQGDVRSSPMAYPAVRPLPKLPLPPRPDTGPTS